MFILFINLSLPFLGNNLRTKAPNPKVVLLVWTATHEDFLMIDNLRKRHKGIMG